MITIGNNIDYSLSAILFSFCILRLYVCVKVIRYWNFYSNEKSKRIVLFFKNTSIDLFLYKSNIKANGLLTITFIFIVVLYLFALIFKIYEDYKPSNDIGFSYYLNCLWFLVVTVTTGMIVLSLINLINFYPLVGYGDMVPATMIGRIVAVWCCMIGIFILSLLVVALMHFTLLDAEEEIAYKEIDVAYTQTQANNFISHYFDSYIKYKMWKFKKEREMKEYFIKKNKYKIKKEAHLIKIKASLQKPFDLAEFCKNAREGWNEEVMKNKYLLAKNVDHFDFSLDPLILKTKDSLNLSKTSKKYSFKLFNLSRLMVNLGSKFDLQSKISL